VLPERSAMASRAGAGEHGEMRFATSGTELETCKSIFLFEIAEPVEKVPILTNKTKKI
jgi:hypothetical protein